MLSYKPYTDALDSEKKRNLWQPKDDRDLLVPLPPPPGTYDGVIWDTMELGSKIVLRLELHTDKGPPVLYDWEVWKSSQGGQLSYMLQQLHRVMGPTLNGKQFKQWRIDSSGNVLFKSN